MNTPTPAPDHKSFKVTKGAYGVWWMYKWQPTLALILMGALGLGIGFFTHFQGIDVIIASIAGVVVALVIGFLYNLLAQAKGWQKLSWHDIWPSVGI